MTPKNFNYSFVTAKSMEEVFNRLLDVRQWWVGLYDENISGQSQNTGDEFNFKAGGGLHETKQKLVEILPNKRIVWEVTKSHLSFLSDPTEWAGTKICFDLDSKGSKTEVKFTHEGLVPEIECYTNCSSAWKGYMKQLQESLD